MNHSLMEDIIALHFIDGAGDISVLKSIEAGDNFSKWRDKIKEIKSNETYKEEIKYIKENSIVALCFGAADYPDMLNNIYGKPPILFCKGKIEKQDNNSIAIVGARRCSDYGLNMAQKIAFDLAKAGITVVSGMARGIDSAAHKGALLAGGRTIAVLGSGFKHVYSRESGKMVNDISSNGAVVTEFLSDINPDKWTFPKRNRIISGLAKGVVVVEAAKDSGALITADFALEHGRDVFAVPGRADFYASQGTNKLIQNGAKLVTNAEDILEEIRFDILSENKHAGEINSKIPTGDEKKVIEALSAKSPSHIDDILINTGLSHGKLMSLLLTLETEKLIKAVSGSRYIRVSR